MDQEIRNKLRNVVTQCRKLLEDSVSRELEGKYGIFAKKDQVTADPNATMTHLTDEEQAARKDILDHFGHIKARGFKPKDALDQLVREIAFTHLNRLCAYKMMEARDVYICGQKFREAVSRGINSNGVKFYLADHTDEERLFNTGHQDVAYRHFLDWLGGLLSEEVGVLFNPNDPANRLYPRQKTLDEVLNLLNNGNIKPEETDLREAWPKIWSQDETIGWVYQYFTPKELRDQARKESAAPRNSYELAFRNQFFTPRYVVEFLTDNTLGRIWYEMRKGDTKLKDQCRYMVHRPTEVFLLDGEQPPAHAVEGRDDLSQEELLKRPVHILHRPKKDPRAIRLLDPACGSGHFLLYCFDLFLTIYEEAYADPDLGAALQKDYSTLEELRRDVPRLILANNLHGIDIDLRCSQIAALALWLRCQRAYQEMGQKKDRPKITRSNFVCAEPMPGEMQMLREFVGQLEPKLLGQLVEVVFDKMKLAGEAGLLLKIEEEIRAVVADARKQWLRETTPATDRKGRTLLFSEAEIDRIHNEDVQESLFDVSDISEAQFFEQAEGKVVDALRTYAKQAHSGHRLQRRLFTDDAERGFAFVDLCHKRFDVVLMNPPFGEMPEPLLKYLTASYPKTKYDLATAFVERAVGLGEKGARLGWISPRTWFSLSLLEPFRIDILYSANSLDSVLDLGIGVLDTALVETACCVLQCGGRLDDTAFVSRLLSSRNKEQDVISRFASNAFPGQLVSLSVIRALPRAAFGYWFPVSFALHLRAIPRFDANGGDAKQGLATTDDFRFLRCLWEVPLASTGFEKRWVPFAKGGEYEPYFDDIHLVIDYEDDGRVLKRYLMSEKGQKHWSRRIASSDYYGRCGLTYPERTTSDLSLRPLPSGSIFSATGQAVFLPDELRLLSYLGLSYTRIFKQLIELYVGSGDASESGSAARDYTSGILNEMKVPLIDEVEGSTASSLVREAIALRRKEFRCLEESQDFLAPALIEAGTSVSLGEAASIASKRYYTDVMRLLEIGSTLDAWACRLYGLDPDVAKRFLAEEVCPLPFEYARNGECDTSKVAGMGISELVKTLCETHGYRRAYTKKAYWANRRIELTAHLLAAHPVDLSKVPLGDVTRHLEHPAADVVSYCVGVIFGRWDVRRATAAEQCSAVNSNPFRPVPSSPPGMLAGDDGLALTTSPVSYPVVIEQDGIVVDDAESSKDLPMRTRDVLEAVWGGRVDIVEEELCRLLNVKELRDYLRKPGNGGFWDDHVRRYSKSRRNAPIYWLMQSSKKNYAVWLYYHRLDKDLFFKALVNCVEPKIRLELSRLETLRTQSAAAGDSGKDAKRLAKDVERQEDLLSELRDFEDRLRRVANLHLDPDLNDGVVLNIAPLHELVPWKEAKNYWDELLEGKYEWSSIGKQLRQKELVK
jgi:hypothetical protein